MKSRTFLGLCAALLLLVPGLLPWGVRAEGDSDFPIDPSGPQIVSVSWSDPATAGWGFTGWTKRVIITTNGLETSPPVVNFAMMESATTGPQSPPADLSAMLLGDHIYTATATGNPHEYYVDHTIVSTAMGGGPVLVFMPTDGPMLINDMDYSLMIYKNISMAPPAEQAAECDASLDPSTDLSQVTDFRSVDLVMGCGGQGYISFSDLDLTADATMEGIRTIGEMMDADQGGEFGLADGTIAYLRDHGAQLTMYLPEDLAYLFEPGIKVDGGDVEDGQVSGIAYDPIARTLTFLVTHFSTYQAVPSVEITEPADGATTTNEFVTVHGRVNDPDATVSIINEEVPQGDVTVDDEGYFQKAVVLKRGENNISISATNEVGTSYAVNLTVTREAAAAAATDSSTTLPAAGLPLALFAAFGLLGVGVHKLAKKAKV